MSSQPQPSARFLRNEQKTSGNVQLTREVYYEPDGTLTQELSIWKTDTNAMISAAQWTFNTDGDYGTHLANLDMYWEKLGKEFENITSRAQQYTALKTLSGKGTSPDPAIANIPARTLKALAHNLLDQHPSDNEFATIVEPEAYSPLTTINQRFKAVRNAAVEEHVKLDAFETAIMNLSRDVYEAIGRFDDVVLGAAKPDDMVYTAPDGESRDTDKDADDYGIGEEWRESLDDDDEPATDDEYFDDEDDKDERQPAWQPEDADAWKKSGGQLEYGAFSHDDSDSERDHKLNELVDNYLGHVQDFMDAAEFIWLDAATRIQNGSPVMLHKQQLEGLKLIQKDVQAAYDAFREACDDLGASSFEMAEVYDKLEDPDTGPNARMQQVISMAQRPDLLEDTIRKALPPQRRR